MPAAILSPQTCSPAELDRYLANGWRPLGQRIYIADFVQLDLGEIFSVIHTRLSLKTHQWRKGQRKLLNKNKSIFRWEIVPAKIDEIKLAINRQYLAKHPTKSTDDLSIHLSHEGRNIFATYECNVYAGEELIAFSFFDLGEKSAYSKAGIYNPNFHKHSLGLFTMYLEVEWCKANGYTYYYPGYISPDNTLFDYKKRIGSLDFWHMPKNEWLPLNIFENTLHGPYQLLLQHNQALVGVFKQAQLQAKLFLYVFFEMRMIDSIRSKNMLANPFIVLLDAPSEQEAVIAIYNLEISAYQCWLCSFDRIFTFFDEPKTNFELFRCVLELGQLLFQTDTPTEFLAQFIHYQGNKPQKI
ncbi:MAG: GNAT family N-acetyltransferase [Bacteroidota bacterium]